MQIMKKIRVWLKSTPGMYAQYDGKVDVYSESTDYNELMRAALNKLKSTFPDRQSPSFWKITKVEILFN
jgi:hypothetical protein